MFKINIRQFSLELTVFLINKQLLNKKILKLKNMIDST